MALSTDTRHTVGPCFYAVYGKFWLLRVRENETHHTRQHVKNKLFYLYLTALQWRVDSKVFPQRTAAYWILTVNPADGGVWKSSVVLSEQQFVKCSYQPVNNSMFRFAFLLGTATASLCLPLFPFYSLQFLSKKCPKKNNWRERNPQSYAWFKL